uniref:Uncharacterized protein n=1 Tax=Spongospora subterranea TaxID=70186 RepID=A0A0H5QPA6_9EUKA|eukprot:CRZ03930.1 hypothetical protein [Spongospora subterranea]
MRECLTKEKECPICGTQTTVACTICDVHVCGEKAFGQRRSCWDILHTAQRIEKRDRPCRESGARGRCGRRRVSGHFSDTQEPTIRSRGRVRTAFQSSNP